MSEDTKRCPYCDRKLMEFDTYCPNCEQDLSRIRSQEEKPRIHLFRKKKEHH